MDTVSVKKFLIVGLGCAVAYGMFGPIGLGVLALFVLLNTSN